MRFYIVFERNQDGTMPSVHDSSVPTLDFKYVIISGMELSRMKQADIDINDIDQLESYLDISLK